MQSKRKLAPVVGRDGISGTRGSSSGREQDIALVEIDATFARTLGLSDGQKVTASLHVDPPLAQTINIEPLTPADWEIIELHATFLEINLLSQIRALPNPAYAPVNGQIIPAHPLTLHLSPTSTANITVISLAPSLPSSASFAKISPNAEVIVAPKVREKTSRSSGRDTRSVASTSRRSVSGKSALGSSRRKAAHEEDAKPAMFLRGLDRGLCEEWFEDNKDSENQGLRIWVDRDILLSKSLRGVSWVSVMVIKPAGLQLPVDPQRQQQEIDAVGEAGKPATKVVARLIGWDDPPDSRHIALSSALCATMAVEGMVGGIVRIEAALQQASKAVQTLKVYPFALSNAKPNEGLKFGGESKTEREEAGKRIQSMFGRKDLRDGILDGPLTDGIMLGRPSNNDDYRGWEGGIVRFDPPSAPAESGKQPWSWLIGSERKLNVEVQAAIPKLSSITKGFTMGDPLPAQQPNMVGIDSLIAQLQSHLSHLSSVLLTGALGSGKTSLAQLLAYRLRKETLFHTTYFTCRKLVTEETRVSTIRETLTRIFMGASWGARLGGQAVVILDDLDKLCPVETELQVGGENGRSRQISEVVCSVVRQYCGRDSRVVLLATGQAKESLNNVIVGGHVVREIVSLKAPTKEGRRRVLEMVVRESAVNTTNDGKSDADSRPGTAGSGRVEEAGSSWMEGSSASSRPGSSGRADGFMIDQALDFLDLAGQTDGYMPGDLVLLVSRAKGEALIRSVSESPEDANASMVSLTREDFISALKGFTPASLRNVTLQTSTTTFDSIGGLQETRKILLETLQYPTTYAPIFAQCPLRLRSGLLLYGYPGCGKTLLASAVAGECGLNFISVKGPEILNKYIGASEKSVRDLFERAEAARPCVLFFDEFDSIAPKRGHDSTGVTDRVVNQLLTQMDGAEGLSGVYVLAATSRPDLIDPALLRPGRLDKSLICDLPNLSDRTDILRALGKKLKLSPEVLSGPEGGLDEIARRTEGFSGADLQALITNSQLEAIHDALGDQKYDDSGKPKKTNGKTSASSQDFIQFRYGSEVEALESAARLSSGQNRSKELADRTAIVSKLEAIKIASKKQKLAQRGQLGVEKTQKEVKEQKEVVIGWKHVMSALKGTRASISADERRRLERIYREFVVGRNGEMPNGQGGTEVGGRSSLM
jgi:peroxin-1